MLEIVKNVQICAKCEKLCKMCKIVQNVQNYAKCAKCAKLCNQSINVYYFQQPIGFSKKERLCMTRATGVHINIATRDNSFVACIWTNIFKIRFILRALAIG